MSAITLPCPVHESDVLTEEAPEILTYLGKSLFVIQMANAKYYQKKSEDDNRGIVATRWESVANQICEHTKQLSEQNTTVIEVNREKARQLARESRLPFVFVCDISVEEDRFVIEEEIPA